MRAVLAAALLLLLGAATMAQTTVQLEKELASAKGNDRVDLLNRIAFSYWSNDPKRGIETGKQALELSRQIGYSRGMARAHNCIGINFWVQGDYASALEQYAESLKISRSSKDTSSESNTLNNMGKLYSEMGSHDRALESYSQTLKIKQGEKDLYGEARVLNNIGEVYLELKRYDEASDFFNRSLLMKEKDAKDREGLATAYMNIGEVYRGKKDFKKALEYYQRSLAISRETGKKSGTADVLFSMAEVQLASGQMARSHRSFESALAQRMELGDKKGIASCKNRIGSVEMRMGRFVPARKNLEGALQLAIEINAKMEIINGLESLSELSAAQGDYRQALDYYQRYNQVRDEVYTQESSQKVANMSILFEMEQKEKEIELQRLKLVKQKQIVFLFVMLIFLVLVTLGVIIGRYRMKSRVNRELAQLNVKLDLLTRTDPLTQLANRRDFVEKITTEITRFMRSRRVFTVVMGDIDDFKQINDRFGHESGDYVLVTVAALIRETVREQDMVARWGGEEFIMLLPDTPPDGGMTLSWRICEKIASHSFVFAGQKLKVTMTFGVAAYAEGQRTDDCIAKADLALYEGKAQGKNRVVLQGS